MNTTIHCQHACRTTCALLNAILREETDLMKMYEQALTECDSADVKSFVQEMMVAKSRSILSILQKLNELRARGEIGDGVMASFQ
jgi:hypothetical protein